MTDLLTRRRFIAALAASVVAVGAPLPIGFPKKWNSKSGVNLKRYIMFKAFSDTMVDDGNATISYSIYQLQLARFAL